MKIETHIINDIKIAEIVSETMIINNNEDGLNLLGNLYYQGFDRIIVHEKNITPNFFDLKIEWQAKYFKSFLITVSGWQ